MLEDNILNIIKEKQMDYAFIMIYFFDQVIIGKYINNILFIPCQYNEELCDEIHIFNKDREIRWTREYDKYIEITDTKDFFEEEMYLIGNKSEIKDGYSIVTQYGREVILPFEINIKHTNELRLVVHNLFSEEDSYICGYRLVDIVGGE